MATIIPTIVGDVTEHSTCWLTLTFFNALGVAAVPAHVTYRIDDQASETEILDDTSLTPASSISVKLTPTDNRILNDTNESEYREVTVHAGFDASDECNAKVVYRVDNLKFLV
jgi:hypothetical protein